jgi:hypothetical protein
MNTLHKSWQDKRPGWTRRVRWYDRPDGSVRLCFENEFGKQNEYYDNANHAQSAFDAFKETK